MTSNPEYINGAELRMDYDGGHVNQPVPLPPQRGQARYNDPVNFSLNTAERSSNGVISALDAGLKSMVPPEVQAIRNHRAGNIYPPEAMNAYISVERFCRAKIAYEGRKRKEKTEHDVAIRRALGLQNAADEAKRARRDKAKKIVFVFFVIVAIAINCRFLREVIDCPFMNEYNNQVYGVEVGMFEGWWPVLWPAWISMAVTFVLTAILGRIMFEDKSDALYAPFLEVGGLLVWAIVIACMYPPFDSIVENILACLFIGAIGYAVPVIGGGIFAIAMLSD